MATNKSTSAPQHEEQLLSQGAPRTLFLIYLYCEDTVLFLVGGAYLVIIWLKICANVYCDGLVLLFVFYFSSFSFWFLVCLD